MSLTSFVREKEVRNKMKNVFPKPHFHIEAKIVVPPQSENYRLVGTAFDYILRFWFERNYSGAARERWVAHLGTETLIEMAKEGKIDPEIEGKAKRVLQQAEERHEKYLERGKLTNGLLQSALDLAKLDGAFRAPKKVVKANPPEKFGASDSRDIEDLRSLYKAIPQDQFSSGSNALLNPTFGEGSVLVGGADADLIIDRTLIDVKTTKKLRLEANYWRQLVGYAVLADVASKNNLWIISPEPVQKTEIPQLNKVGIYFSRHGKLWTLPASQIYEHDKYQEFVKWFVSTAARKYDVETIWRKDLESEQRKKLRENPVEMVKTTTSFRKILKIVKDNPVRRSKLSKKLGIKRNTLAKYLGDLRSTGLVEKDPGGKPKDALCKITERGKKYLK